MLAENKNSSFDSCSSTRGSIFSHPPPLRVVYLCTYSLQPPPDPVRLFALSTATSLHSWHKRGYIIQYQIQYIHDRRYIIVVCVFLCIYTCICMVCMRGKNLLSASIFGPLSNHPPPSSSLEFTWKVLIQYMFHTHIRIYYIRYAYIL